VTNPVIVALDFPTAQTALDFVGRLSPRLCRLKIGKELFTSSGPDLVRQVQDLGFEVFLDLKYHDIPNTVAGAVAAAARLGVWMLNVHAGGGSRMMTAAREALESSSHRPLLIGVTVLTSMGTEDLLEVGCDEPLLDRVVRLSRLAADSGLDGVVCSAAEAAVLREIHGANFCLVTPGIRFGDGDRDDQRRVVTPAEAIARGSDYLVMGRSITGAADPLAALERVHRELGISA